MLIGPALTLCRPVGLAGAPDFFLDFSAGAVPGTVAVTRAGATATYIDASGERQTAPENTPRLHYPRAGSRRVLLREPDATNLILASRDISNGNWYKGNASVSGTNVLVASMGTEAQGVVQGIEVTPNTPHCVSAEFSRRNGRYGQLMSFSGGPGVADDFEHVTVDLDSGAVVGAAAGAVYGVERGASGTWLVWLLFAQVEDPANPYVGAYAGDASGDFAPNIVGTGQELFSIDEFQVEVGGGPTSRIRTTWATASRAEDVIRVTGSNFSAFWNATAGTLLFKGSFPYPPPSAAFPALLSANNGGATERINLYAGIAAAALGVVIVDDNAAVATQFISGVLLGDDEAFRVVGAFAANDAQAAAAGGNLSAGDNTVSLPIVTQLEIGRQTAALAGLTPIHIDAIGYWRSRLPASVLQTLSQ